MFSPNIEGLTNTFQSSCGLEYKILHIMKRKIKWTRASKKEKDKVIPEDARETEELVLDVESYMGPENNLL